MHEKRRIVLGEDDFVDPDPPPEVSATAPPTRPSSPPAPDLPSVTRGAPRRVDGLTATPSYAAESNTPEWMTAPKTAHLVAAAIGILGGWIVTEVTAIQSIAVHSRLGLDARAGLWTGVIGLVFGGTVLAYDSAVGGAWGNARARFARATLPMFGASFVAGFLAQVVYSEILKSILEQAIREALRGGSTLSENDVRLYLARALGWALFGVGIGVTVGLLRKSNRLAINGAIGGAIGGAVGGLVFEFVGVNLGLGEALTRLVGLAAVGGLIAVATRAVETARRQAWLHIVAGGMVGKEFILYHEVTRIGASPDCEIFLVKDPAVEKLHAQIADRDGHRLLTALSNAPVYVNAQAAQSQALRNGDQLQIGSTVMTYSERAEQPA